MLRLSAALCVGVMLSACMQVPSEEAPVPETVVESVAELPPEAVAPAPKRGLLAGLLGPRDTGEEVVAELVVEEDVAEEADAPKPRRFALFRKRADAPVSEESATEEAVEVVLAEPIPDAAPAPRKGFFLFRKAAAPEPAPVLEPVKVKEVAEAESAPVAEAPKVNRAGIFGFLRRQPQSQAQAQVVLASADAGEADAIMVAPTKQKRRRARKGPDQREVPFGTVLPFGEIARVCDAPRSRMGKKILRASGYVIHDSRPGLKEPHTFYITGFADGCARQLTAALVTFGSASMHEMIRYGLPSKTQPYSETDKSYEKIKRSVCGVGRKKPCGTRVGLIEKNTVFVSYYENFKGNREWSNILLHDGAVAAVDSKTGRKG